MAHLQTSDIENLSFSQTEDIKNALDQHAIVGITDLAGRITYVNEKFCEISGYMKEELLGQNHRILNSGYHSPEFFKQMWKTISSGSNWQGEIKNKAKNGSFYWVDVIIVPLKAQNDRVTGYVAIRVDITDKKLVEERTKRSHEELQSLYNNLQRETDERIRLEKSLIEQHAKFINLSKMAALGEMAGGIAHEINNPLTIINLTAHYLKSVTEKSLKEFQTVAEKVNTIQDTIGRITRIIDGLRIFSHDASSFPKEKTKIKTIIDQTLQICNEKFRTRGVVLRIIPISENIEIECNSTQISQVLLNLLNNSFDAIVNEKKPWIELSVKDEGKYIKVTVKDSGKGIAKGVQKKLFQPFFTTKEIGKGTGLGLSISKGIVENHGGTLILDIDSPNTSFEFTLPHDEDKNL